MNRWTMCGAVALVAAGSSAASQLTGAKIAPSGYATIEQAPPSPFPDQLPPPEQRPKNERGFYASMAGTSDAEAATRIREQQPSRPAFQKLRLDLAQRLRMFEEVAKRLIERA